MTAKSKVQSIEPNIADMANSWLNLVVTAFGKAVCVTVSK